MAPPVQCFSHVGLCVADLGRALAFYRDGLGFREVSRLAVSGPAAATLLELPGAALRAVFLERDGVRLELLHYEAPRSVGDGTPSPLNRRGLTHLSVRVADLDSALARLERAGARVLHASRIELPEARTRAVFALDPDGVRVELVEAPGDPTAPPGA